MFICDPCALVKYLVLFVIMDINFVFARRKSAISSSFFNYDIFVFNC